MTSMICDQDHGLLHPLHCIVMSHGEDRASYWELWRRDMNLTPATLSSHRILTNIELHESLITRIRNEWHSNAQDGQSSDTER